MKFSDKTLEYKIIKRASIEQKVIKKVAMFVLFALFSHVKVYLL